MQSSRKSRHCGVQGAESSSLGKQIASDFGLWSAITLGGCISPLMQPWMFGVRLDRGAPSVKNSVLTVLRTSFMGAECSGVADPLIASFRKSTGRT